MLTNEDLATLVKELVAALQEVDRLKAWLRKNYQAGLPRMLGQDLRNELVTIARAADADDGMQELFQSLADDPPSDKIPGMIFAFTHGDVRPRARTAKGLPEVSPDVRWFAADRPFVNRSELRTHLRELGNAQGAQSILVIEGKKRTGKSFTISLLNEFKVVLDSPVPVDVDQFDRVGDTLDARTLATEIIGDEAGCPPMDPTKEEETVPRLTRWMVGRLRDKGQAWIIIDHCNRRALTDGARRILSDLATYLRQGSLPKVRLILIDYDRSALPKDFRDSVRYDQAKLPTPEHVETWCKELATAANRVYDAQDPAKWASEAFVGLDAQSQDDGSWHAALEQQLRGVFDKIMACKVRV